jgi:uncharacterized membrane protein
MDSLRVIFNDFIYLFGQNHFFLICPLGYTFFEIYLLSFIISIISDMYPDYVSLFVSLILLKKVNLLLNQLKVK